VAGNDLGHLAMYAYIPDTSYDLFSFYTGSLNSVVGTSYRFKQSVLPRDNKLFLLVPRQSVGIDISLRTHVEVYRHAQPPPKKNWHGGPVWRRSNIT
jgi:hypothetical protein